MAILAIRPAHMAKGPENKRSAPFPVRFAPCGGSSALP